MEFLFNDLSIHGQFVSQADFHLAVDRVMSIRQEIQRFGRDLACHKCLRSAVVTPSHSMEQAIQRMDQNKQRAWIQWLTRGGPFWIEDRQHKSDDWFEVHLDTPIEDTAVAEAAYCNAHALPRTTVSMSPSDWEQNPIQVTWRKSESEVQAINVPNLTRLADVKTLLEALPPTYDSWNSLEIYLQKSCDNLSIYEDAFRTFEGTPWKRCVADKICMLMVVLNKMSVAFEPDGQRTKEFSTLYDTFFRGADPYFTDESDDNKRNFAADLSFDHPTDPNAKLFCPWHGKVNVPAGFPPIRIHFNWPINSPRSLFIPYVGEKITRD